MKKRRKKRNGDAGVSLLYMLRAALISCIITVGFMLVLAFLLKWEWFRLETLSISNTVIKTLCAALAGLLFIGFSDGEHLICAGGAGVVYIALSYIIFRLIEQDFTFRLSILSDVALAFIAAIAAALIRNVLKSRGEGNSLST